MQQPDLSSGIIWYVVFVYSTVCHEAAHAWTSYKLGDRTAYDGGQVSLDPTPHVKREPFGMVVVPILGFLLNGWMMGWASAPYNRDWARQHPRRAATMAMAGPLANLLLALTATILILIGAKYGVFTIPNQFSFTQMITSESGGIWEGCAQVLSVMWTLNVLLFVFNLLPLPPLDGSAIPLFFMRGQAAEAYQEMIWTPGLQFIGIVVAVKGFGLVFWPIFIALVRTLYSFM